MSFQSTSFDSTPPVATSTAASSAAQSSGAGSMNNLFIRSGTATPLTNNHTPHSAGTAAIQRIRELQSTGFAAPSGLHQGVVHASSPLARRLELSQFTGSPGSAEAAQNSLKRQLDLRAPFQFKLADSFVKKQTVSTLAIVVAVASAALLVIGALACVGLYVPGSGFGILGAGLTPIGAVTMAASGTAGLLVVIANHSRV